MPRMTYGADADGYLPWVREPLEADGEPLPDLLDDNGSPPFEQIAAAMPDVILANYSGITQADYDKLDQIAPTIAYPDAPWTTPWRDVVTTVGDVLGESDRARVLLDDLDATLADTAAAHPQFAGKSIAAVSAEPAAFYVYNGRDPRVQYLEDLGFEVAPSVAALDTGETDFYYTLSTERLDELTSDVLLSYSDTPGDVQRIAESPEIQAMDQYRRGAVAPVVGTSLISSVSPPTALSLTWGLDDYVAALQEAVAAPG